MPEDGGSEGITATVLSSCANGSGCETGGLAGFLERGSQALRLNDKISTSTTALVTNGQPLSTGFASFFLRVRGSSRGVSVRHPFQFTETFLPSNQVAHLFTISRVTALHFPRYRRVTVLQPFLYCHSTVIDPTTVIRGPLCLTRCLG
jgi:hypothetical protein